MIKLLNGTGVALVTPFKENLEVDYPALERVVRHVTEGNVEYLVVMGTTAESPTISWDERLKILEFVLAHNPGGLPVIFGHGGNNTNDLVQKLDALKAFPLAGILSVNPYYNRPSQEGIFRHYTRIADQAHVPIILYDVPSRTASTIEAATVIRLAGHSNIVGIKDATGDFDRMRSIVAETDEDFFLISGDDNATFPILEIGGSGVISVLGNFLPNQVSEMVRSGLADNWPGAEVLNRRLQKFYQLIVEEGNPSSVKAGLSALGLIEPHVRMPLVQGSESLGEAFIREVETIKKGT